MRIALLLILMFFFVPCFAQSDKATALMEKATILVEEKNYDAAAESYQKAANYFRRKNNTPARINALIKASQTFLLFKETYKAEQYAAKVIQLSSSKDSTEAVGHLLLGQCSILEGQLPEALKSLKRAKKIAEDLQPKNELIIGQATRMIGVTYTKLGQAELALIHANDALNIFQNIVPTPSLNIAATYGTLGEIFSEKKQYDIAIDHFEKAIEMYSKTIGEQQELVAQQFFLLGKNYILRGNYDLGLMNSQRGLTIIEDLKGEEHPERAPFLINLGKVNTINGNYQDAFDYYYDALDLIEYHYGTKDPNLPNNYINIADVLMAQNNVDSALISYQKALNLNLDLYGSFHPIVAQNLNFIALAYAKKGDNTKALKFHNDALVLLQRKYGNHHSSIAKVQQEIGEIFLTEDKFQEALPYFQKALNANVPDFSVKDTINAIPSLNDIFDNYTFLSSLELKAQALTKLSLLDKNTNHIELAQEAYFVCDSLIDDIRRSHIDHKDQLFFNNTVAAIYMDGVENSFLLYQTTKDKKYLDNAFYFSEKNKSNVLLQSFIHDEALRFGDLPDSLEVSENILKSNISFYKRLWLDALQDKDSLQINYGQKKLLEAKEDYLKFVEELEENFDTYKQRKNNTVATSLKQIQKVLDVESGLINLFFGKEKLFIFGITANQVYTNEIALTPKLNNSITNFRKSISDVTYFLHPDSTQHAWKSFHQNAHYIYQTILEDILKKFDKENIKSLIVLPDGELGFLPFEVLTKQATDLVEPNYTELDYLIKNYTIGYDFSGSLFLRHTQDQPLKEQILYGGFAPTYGSGQLSMTNNLANQFINRKGYIDLPASRMAIEQIANLLEGAAFLGRDASAQNFQKHQAEFDILHLAMHGIYDIEQPLNSHLVCTKIADENRIITASEIYNMNIRALLVILGSCNSGFGKLNQGEGVMSISRAFAYAGCPSIIKGLWSLPDEETAAISTHFIQQLKKGNKKDQALRLSKLAYLNSNNSNIPKERFHPFFWAGFVPVGDMSAIYPTDFLTTGVLLGSFVILLLLAALLAYFSWKLN